MPPQTPEKPTLAQTPPSSVRGRRGHPRAVQGHARASGSILSDTDDREELHCDVERQWAEVRARYAGETTSGQLYRAGNGHNDENENGLRGTTYCSNVYVFLNQLKSQVPLRGEAIWNMSLDGFRLWNVTGRHPRQKRSDNSWMGHYTWSDIQNGRSATLGPSNATVGACSGHCRARPTIANGVDKDPN
ncbi:hypothetical protein N7465_011135 [Penicillium sp. CMV-2018d]|nr:hypothetical protein N7465_011135 [Penicillium sp. CMV-2018d]